MAAQAASIESGGVQFPHEFLNPEQPCLLINFRCLSWGEMNSSASREGPGCGWEEAVIAQGAGGGGTVPVGLA